jgi:enoyl-CoA hydratase
VIEAAEDDGIAVLRLARPPVNALDLELLLGITAAFGEVADSRAVVLTGSGGSFSAGADLRRIADAGSDSGRDYVAAFLTALSEAFLAVFDCPRPVVCAVNGHALAGGCVLAAAGDVRIMSGGSIGLTELAVGVPFPVAALEIVRHAVGPAASSLVLTARTMDAAQARSIGLVDEVCGEDDLLPLALDRARRLASVPAEVYALSKEQLHRPARERIEAARPADDPRVLGHWSSPATRGAVAGFLAALRRRPGH